MGDWVVGGPDSTVQELRDGWRKQIRQCKAKARVDPGGVYRGGMVFCTRPIHPRTSPHVAGTGAVIVHVWED